MIGWLSVSRTMSLDYETRTFYRLRFEASDNSGQKVYAYLNVTVTDVNEPPEIINLPATRDVTENVKVGKLLFKIEATDPENHDVTYKLRPAPSDGNFILKPSGGHCWF